MSKYRVTDEVKFYIGGGYVRCNREETFTLEELDFYEDELLELSDSEVEDSIQNSYDDWMVNNGDFGWYVIEK